MATEVTAPQRLRHPPCAEPTSARKPRQGSPARNGSPHTADIGTTPAQAPDATSSGGSSGQPSLIFSDQLLADNQPQHRRRCEFLAGACPQLGHPARNEPVRQRVQVTRLVGVANRTNVPNSTALRYRNDDSKRCAPPPHHPASSPTPRRAQRIPAHAARKNRSTRGSPSRRRDGRTRSGRATGGRRGPARRSPAACCRATHAALRAT